MIRVFCDANVIFSAAISPDGRSSALFRVAAERPHVLIASPHVLEEARRNVAARYPESIKRLGALTKQLEIVPEATQELVGWARTRNLPENDAPVLAAAVQSGAQVLTTGDRTHFGPLFGKKLRGVEVLTLRDALERLTSR